MKYWYRVKTYFWSIFANYNNLQLPIYSKMECMEDRNFRFESSFS